MIGRGGMGGGGLVEKAAGLMWRELGSSRRVN